MKEESIEPKSRVVLVATVLWLLAWLLAVAYGQGFEIQRRVVAIPGVVLAGLLVLPDLLRRQVLWLPGAVVVVLGGLYFSWRALSSPVWDLAREDLLLVSLGLLSVVVGARVMASVRALKVFLGGLVLVFLANAGVALVQEASDPGYAFMRSPRVDQHGVSGLLWHRNYFAGLLELMVPVFLGVTLVSRSRWIRGAFGILVVVGLALGFFSHSRGGLLAIGIGCAAGLFLWLQRGWKSKTWNARLGLTLGGLMVSALVLVGTLALASRVSEQRGASGNLEEALMHSGCRLVLAGCAYDQWMEKPVAGTGAGTFSYLVVRNWIRGRTSVSLGNPKMAHNDYLQTLADYGLVGFVLVVAVMGLGLLRGGRQVLGGWGKESGGRGLQIAVQLGAVGGICGAMIHSGLDYPLRILPNTLLFGLLVGFVFSRAGKESTESRTGYLRPSLAGALGMLLVVVGVAGAFGAGRKELAVLPKWYGFDQAKIEAGHFGGRRGELQEIIGQAPHFELARLYGRMVMGELQVEGEVRPDLLRDGLWAMDLAVERHPFDGESRLVRANFLELAGSDEGAVRDYLKGIEATWKREEQFGALAGFSDYLARCGEQAFQARDPEGALAYYQLALDYLLRSWELKFRGNGWAGHGEKVKFLRGRIEFLTGARVEPATLDGIPPPPQR